MLLRRLPIGVRLGVGFAIVLALLAALVGGAIVLSEDGMGRLARGLETANAKEALAAGMKAALLQEAVATRNIGLQTEVLATQKEDAAVKEQRGRYAAARQQLVALGVTPQEQEILARLDRLDQEAQPHFTEAIGQSFLFNGDVAARIIATQIDPIHARSVVEINKLADAQQAAARVVRADAAQSMARLRALLLALGGIALAVGAACAVVLTRSITQPLRAAVEVATRVAEGDLSSQVSDAGRDETAELMRALKVMNEALGRLVGEVAEGAATVADTSAQIARGNVDLSQRTEEQASTLEETASQMEELTATVTQNADSARSANQLAAGASDIAVKGGKVVGDVVSTMSGIADSSRRIGEIIGVIDAIAFQTNILALNAAVEAARAGDQGRGFAVVASEVRNLAHRSATAAKEIKALIGESVGRVEAGTRQVDAAGSTMQEIVAAVRQVSALVAEITAASAEQSAGIGQVNTAVTQMDQVVQQNAALVEEGNAATESLKQQAAVLMAAIGRFRLGAAPSPAKPVDAPAQPAIDLRVVAPRPVRFKPAVATGSSPVPLQPPAGGAAVVAARAGTWTEF